LYKTNSYPLSSWDGIFRTGSIKYKQSNAAKQHTELNNFEYKYKNSMKHVNQNQL